MRRTGSLLLSLTLFVCAAVGQSAIKRYIKDNTVTIRSISIADTNFSDLAPIGEAIGRSRVVMLGEQDHGDAPTFQAKARLVKYLHQKLGFRIIAFESDFFGLTGAFEQVMNNELGTDSFLQQHLYPIWTTCTQFTDMRQYIIHTQQQDNRLLIAGIDNYFHGDHSIRNFPTETNRFLRAQAIPFVNSAAYTTFFLPMIDTVLYYSARQRLFTDTQMVNKFLIQLDTVLAQLHRISPADHFQLIAIRNLRSTCRHLLLRLTGNYSDIFVERDRQMAENLAWLVNNKYPHEKIIVWAANGHIIKNAIDAVEPAASRHPSLGHYFLQQPGMAAQTYVLGFTSYQGSAGRTTAANSVYTIPAPPKNSFEQWIYQKDRHFAFVDLKPFTIGNPTYADRFSLNGESHFAQKGVWTNCFDGIFYIKDMYPCVKTGP